MQSLTPQQLKLLKDKLNEEELAALKYDWTKWGRPKQLPPPGDWLGWLILAGRGFGKTRTGAEFVRDCVESGKYKRIGLIAETSRDGRDVVVEGDSGILSVCPPWNKPNYESSKKRLTWDNGAVAFLYDAREPDQLRGPQHDLVWMDELAKYRYADSVFEQVMMGLRLGNSPKWIATTTPRPIKLIKNLIQDPTVVTTIASSTENLANLADSFKRNVIDRYKGTRLGRQELEAEILGDIPGALWRRTILDENRVSQVPQLKRIVVGVDPAITNDDSSNETGIIVAGIDKDNQGYILDDFTTKGRPDEWAGKAIAAYHKYDADCIVAEVNQGGLMVESTIRSISPYINFKAVHATRGKYIRAEPISSLYEQGRIHHHGIFPELEDQMVTFTPDTIINNRNKNVSPDRVDALVWVLTELFLSMIIPAQTYQEDWHYGLDNQSHRINSVTGY